MQTYTWLDLDKTYEFDSGFNYEATQKEYQHTAQEVDKLGKNAKMNIDDHSYTKMSEQYRNLVEKRKTL